MHQRTDFNSNASCPFIHKHYDRNCYPVFSDLLLMWFVIVFKLYSMNVLSVNKKKSATLLMPKVTATTSLLYVSTLYCQAVCDKYVVIIFKRYRLTSK